MNNNINFCNILKGHEGETFYSPIAGDIIFNEINNIDLIYPLHFNTNIDTIITFTCDGKYRHSFPNSEIMIFPSKDQRDWNKWIKEQKTKIPKTWSELKATNKANSHCIYTLDNTYLSSNNNKRIIEKSALALLKIHQLIEVGYGGNITNKEWLRNTNTPIFIIVIDPYKDNFMRIDSVYDGFEHGVYHVAFHTKAQAEEFLSYHENLQLLKDYFML